MSNNLSDHINTLLGDLAIGLTISGAISKLMPEVIHASATIITGLITTACIFFLQRTLKKYFPENKK